MKKNMYFFRRWFALIIDIIVVLVITIPLVILVLVNNKSISLDSTTQMYIQLVSFIALLIYYIISECFFGETIGKKLMGLTIKSITPKKISFFRVLIRNLLRILDQGLFIGYLLIFVSKKKQRIGDMISGIIVTMKQ
ncbi:RDD family protein [Paenibacillus glycanilyticus]|uniref:RDD family protein n=1 Tax=Paenibacillus glycanilyticus TaxID=126569 RepID=UPI0037CA7006